MTWEIERPRRAASRQRDRKATARPSGSERHAASTTAHPLEDPTFAKRYRAISSRDARFDGQFIVGVHTTGIYCRPSCPATTPKPENVSFYLTAAAAHEAGFRACKRCLPDAVPGSPEWNVRDDVAARTMRLIADGMVDREGVAGLATALGYTSRHLGRILVSELGAGPLALARAHRAQTARLLLASTDLPVTDIAFAAGFGSVRQFNDTVQAVYETTPSGLRRSALRRRGPRLPASPRGEGLPPFHGRKDAWPQPSSAEAGPEGAHPGVLSLRLPARAPFDAREVLRFLADRAIPGVESGSPDRYARVLRMPHGPAWMAIAPSREATGLTCDVRVSDVSDLATLVSRIRRLFDLDADAQAIDDALGSDPELGAEIRAHPGSRVPGSIDPAETLIRALIGQQVSVAGARTTLSRLTTELGTPLTGVVPESERSGAAGTAELTHLFPTAAQLADGAARVIKGPAKRTATVVEVAGRLASGSLTLDVGQSKGDLEARLLEIPGIGPWTAGYVAMRVLGSPDILLVEDLALRNGAARLGLPADSRALARRGVAWAPWRSYAGMHLWRRARA